MSLRDLISIILEKNIILFENEYSNALKTVFSEVLASNNELITKELINEELEKIDKGVRHKGHNHSRTRPSINLLDE